MTKHFYAIDHNNKAQPISAFTLKTSRDIFVEDGNCRSAWPRVEANMLCQLANMLCQLAFGCNASEAVVRGYI
jgi:hypothetical protein